MTANDPNLTEHVADVVVVGAGASGLAAAIEAASLGRKVILLEKNPKVGGMLVRSVGLLSANNTRHQRRKGIKDSPDAHFEDFGQCNNDFKALKSKYFQPEDNLALRRIMVDNIGETFHWLEAMGVDFFGPLLEPPHRKARIYIVLPNSRAYGYWLERRARSLGIDIRTQRRGVRLRVDGNSVYGVECTTETGAVERYRARGGVVLASGDYSAGEEFKRRYVGPQLAGMTTMCEPANTGDGHVMGLEVGARMRNPDFVWAQIRFIDAPRRHLFLLLPPWRIFTRFMAFALEYLPRWLLQPFIMPFLTSVLEAHTALLADGAILINKQGDRFCDELDGPEFSLHQQPDEQAYIVFDRRLANKYSEKPHYVSTAPGIGDAYIQDYRKSRPDIFHTAPTIEALARKIGVDAAKLARAVNQRNASLSTAANTPSQMLPIELGPFYALGPVTCRIPGTDGGLAINDKFQVLNGDEPIPGLFGAGLCGQGGVMLQGHGHHIGWSLTSGRLAGRYAAYLANSDDPVQE